MINRMILPGFYQNNKKNKFLFNQKPPGSPSTFHNTSEPFTDEFTSLSLCITRVAIYEERLSSLESFIVCDKNILQP